MPAPTTQNFFDASNWVYGYSDSNALPPIPVGLTPFYYKTDQFDSGLLPSGFHGAAFLIPGVPPQVIIAFEGTDVSGLDTRPDFLLAQLEADVSLFVGVVPQALRDAAAFTQEVLTAANAQGIQAGQVHLTGHSLGAAAASYASTRTGLDGTTFAAPGLPSNAVPFGGAGTLTNYVDYGDPVGNYSATPNNIEDGFLYSNAIRRVGDPRYIGDILDSGLLAAAAASAAPGNPDPVRAAGLVGLGALAAEYHPLTNYGEDLNLLLTDTPVLADGSRIVSGKDYAQFYGDIIDRNFLVGDAFYAIHNPDVREAGIDAERHYDQYGWREGRDPDAFFSTTGYLAANPDVRAANVNPLQHFDQYGWREGAIRRRSSTPGSISRTTRTSPRPGSILSPITCNTAGPRAGRSTPPSARPPRSPTGRSTPNIISSPMTTWRRRLCAAAAIRSTTPTGITSSMAGARGAIRTRSSTPRATSPPTGT